MRRRLTAALALTVAALLGGGAAVAAGGTSQATVNEGRDVITTGCIIRFSDPDGSPSIFENPSHKNTGCTDTYIDRHGNLVVEQTIRDTSRFTIVSTVVNADETLNRRGISLGASGGVDKTTYTAFDARLGRQLDLNDRSDRMRIQGAFSNAWLTFHHVEKGR